MRDRSMFPVLFDGRCLPVHTEKRGITMNDMNRRSGTDRRGDLHNVNLERRDGAERRSVVSDTDRMIGFLRKIPVFSGLTHDQYKKLLYICYNKTIPADCFLFEQDDKSDAMFILLNGRLKVLSHKSTLVSYTEPVALVGEIGFFTGENRRISVVTIVESGIIKINKTELFRILHADSSLSNRILLNVINELVIKLGKYTEIIQELRSFKDAHIQ